MDVAAVATVNFDELQEALGDAPGLAFTYVKQEKARFGKRFRKQFVAKWLQGAPGIQGRGFTKGKHVQGFAAGQSLTDLRTVVKVSRILRTHVEGAVITPKAGPWLYLAMKTGKAGHGRVFARVRRVVIPARIPFVAEANAAIKADLIPKIHNALVRAMRVAMERRVRKISSAVKMVANA